VKKLAEIACFPAVPAWTKRAAQGRMMPHVYQRRNHRDHRHGPHGLGHSRASALGGDYARVGTICAMIYALGLVVIWFAPDTSRNDFNS